MVTTQILAGAAGSIAPQIVLGVDTEREARNIVHPILGSALSDVSLRPASLRKGILTLGFFGPTADADSLSALDIHAGGNVLTLVSIDRPSSGMTYVCTGRVSRQLEDQTRDAWIVTVEYEEVRSS